MERILVSELAEHAGKRATVMGWLHRQRRLSQVTFLILRDRSGLGQVVITDAAHADEVAGLMPESVLAITGDVLASPQAPAGAELHNPEIAVLSAPAEAPPVELWRPKLSAQLPRLLDLAPVTLRHLRQRAVFEIAAASIAGFRAALDSLGFTEIQTPKIVASATESGANVFVLDYFGRPAYLAQSPSSTSRPWSASTSGSTRRVRSSAPEPHDTPRHLSEYVSLDAELGFIVDHRDVMRTRPRPGRCRV